MTISKTELIADLMRVKEELEGYAGEIDCIEYTLASNEDYSGYAAQTGDNSYTGSAYSFPFWAVGQVSLDTDLSDLANDLLEQLAEQIACSV